MLVLVRLAGFARACPVPHFETLEHVSEPLLSGAQEVSSTPQPTQPVDAFDGSPSVVNDLYLIGRESPPPYP